MGLDVMNGKQILAKVWANVWSKIWAKFLAKYWAKFLAKDRATLLLRPNVSCKILYVF
jgi:hypothetical protein